MVEVNVYGPLSVHLKARKLKLEAKSLNHLFRLLNEMSHGKIKWHEKIIFLNGEACNRINFVKLKSGDVVSILTPAAGG